MKKYAYLAFALVLTTSLLVGCGCTNRNMDNTSAPTVLPTNEEVWDTTESTTRATTETTRSTQPSETFDRGNGPLENDPTGTVGGTENTNTTDTTENTGAMEGRSRSIMPGTK